MIRGVTGEEFQKIVDEALNSLPKEFKKQLDNVAVAVEPWPSAQDLRSIHARRGTTLFGLYRGIPKTKRWEYSAVLPDKIVIFAGPILSSVGTIEEAKAQIRETVLHEIGHHFGMSEEDLKEKENV